MINSSRVAPCLIGADHGFLYFELKCDISNATNSSQPRHPTTIHFTHEHFDIYSRHVQDHLSSLDPSLPLESLTIELTHILHCTTINSFPYTKHSNQCRVGSMPQNRWYDDDCRDLNRQLKVPQLGDTITSVQARKEMCKMTVVRDERGRHPNIGNSTTCS